MSRGDIYARLSDSEDRDELAYFLDNLPEPDLRSRYIYLVYILAALLAAVTVRKLIMATSWVGGFNAFSLLSLVVPTINIYLIREVLLFHRNGFQFTAILSLISLVNAENRVMPEVVIMPLTALLAGFLFFRMFPKETMISK